MSERAQRSTGYLLARVCREQRTSVGELLAGLGLYVGQEMVLMALWEEDGLGVCELASRLRVEPPTVTRMLGRMERAGLLERRRDPCDGRSFRVHLTADGRALEEGVDLVWAEADERALLGLSEEERRRLHELLGRVLANLRSRASV